MKKYTIDDFKFFIDEKIFIYVGEDKKGRPIILNTAANVKIQSYDPELYSDFYIYWLEIFLPTKMRGHVDQLVILADVSNLSMESFKLQVTRRNISDNLKYGPERQVKLYAMNAGNTAYFCWKLIKPLLPHKTHDKVMITSTNIQERIKEMSVDIDVEVIPSHLGGENVLKELQ